MTASNHVLGAGEASLAIARVTIVRTLRGKSLWVVLALCLLPELYGLAALQEHDLDHWGEVFGMGSLLIALLPPILLANTIGEEIEEKTMAYLWSRPLPRWSILTGKMVALVPLLAVMLTGAMVLPFFTALGSDASSDVPMLGRAIVAGLFGTAAASAVTAGLATLAPRFGIVLGIAYLVIVDGALAALDSGLSRLTVAYNTQHLAGTDGTADLTAVPWLLGIIALWLTIAALRIRRIE